MIIICMKPKKARFLLYPPGFLSVFTEKYLDMGQKARKIKENASDYRKYGLKIGVRAILARIYAKNAEK